MALTVNVKDPPYNAVGDDVHDDTLAFRTALADLRRDGGTCTVPIGTYKIAETGITGNNAHPCITDGVHMVGVRAAPNRPRSILHVHGKATKSIINCSGNNWSIENIELQMSGLYETNPTPPPVYIVGAGPITVLNNYAAPANGWLINNCRITNTGSFALVARGTNWQVSNCYFNSAHGVGLGANPPHRALEILGDTSGSLTRPPSYGRVINNVFDGAGIGEGGNNLLIQGNNFSRIGYSTMYLGAADYSKAHDNIIIGNTMHHNEEGIKQEPYNVFNWSQAGGMEVWAPHNLIAFNNSHDNPGYGFMIGGRNSVVAFNKAINNGRDTSGDPAHVNHSGFWVRSILTEGRHNQNASGSIWLGNIARDELAVGKTQLYGVEVQADWISCVSFVGNNFHGNATDEGFYRNCEPNVGIAAGRDIYENNLDEKQRELLKSLFNYNYLNDNQYIMLNQVITGSTLGRS